MNDLMFVSIVLCLTIILLDAPALVCSARNKPTYNYLHSTVKEVRDIFGSTMGWFGSPHFQNANDIPADYFKTNKEIKGVVVKVTDGDTFRLRHVTYYHPASEFNGKLVENSIAVRIAAVDAPEIAKGSSSGQKYGEAAKDFAVGAIMGKKVTIKLLSRDQYGRVLALVRYRDNTFLPNFLCSKKDLFEQLLLKGLAVVYRSGGAQYDGSVDRWNLLEQQAIRGKRGLWKDGVHKVDLPSDYKRKSRESSKSRKREFTQV